jgi:hypothetical protein
MRNLLIILLWLLVCPYLRAQDEINTDVEKIIFVFKTHFDIGYTDLAEAVLQKYESTLIKNALDVLDRTKGMPPEKHFVWTLPAWPMDQILKRSDGEAKKKIEDAIRNGWFVIHALPFTVQTEACDADMLVRGLKFATDISKKYDIKLPRDAKLTDVPSHSWFIPTLLRHAGVDFLHIGCNPASSSPEIPLLFWWEGPDGSRLMTMYWAGYYGTSITPPKGWPHKTWLAIIHTNDNHGPPAPEMVKEILDKASNLAPNAELRIGRISDFYDALINEEPELEVVRGDMPDTWIHGFMSMPREVKTNRKIKKDIISLEILNTLLGIWAKKQTDLATTISAASENTLLFDEHTFGMAIEHGHSGYWSYGDEFKLKRAKGVYNLLESSWKEKGDRVYQAEKMILPTLRRRLQTLAQSVAVEGRRIVVFNALPWERDGLVRLQVSSKSNPFTSVKDLQTGELIRISNQENVLQFIAHDVPSYGYKTFVPAESSETYQAKTEEKKVIENKFFRIQIDPDMGVISSLINKNNGVELVDQSSQWKFGQYLYERFSKKNTTDYTSAYVKGGWNWALNEMGRPNLSAEPHKMITNKNPEIHFTKNHLLESVDLLFHPNRENRHTYSLTIALYKDLPYVEMVWHIENKAAEPWPEGGWICFPVNIDNPNFRLGRLGAVVDPTKDFIKGSNFDYCFLNAGMAIFDDEGTGLGICSPDAPAISLGEPGLWKYSGYRIPQKSHVYFNLYNNQWSTNFTEWIEGSWSIRFHLWAINNYENESAIITPSEEARIPLLTAMATSGGGELKSVNSGIRLSEKGILVGAFCENPEGDGTLLRLWETSGKNSRCEIILPKKASFKSARYCNLRGELEKDSSDFDIKEGKFTIVMKAYQPVSVILY